jgi:hypothetical protein
MRLSPITSTALTRIGAAQAVRAAPAAARPAREAFRWVLPYSRVRAKRLRVHLSRLR